MRIGIRKIFGDLQLADWDTMEVFGLGIRGLIITKFADLRLPNEPKNLLVCNLQTNPKSCVPTFANPHL